MIGCIAFCYVLIRSITVGITYDEVWTINEFVSQNILNIINYTPCDANNHILNTLLIKLFFLFGNHSLFIARLPNVLSFILYLYYGHKITAQYLSPITGIACFLLLLLNPFLLDFFSIARGYGLSLAFLLTSIYFAFKFDREARVSHVWRTIGFGAIAVLCNFSLLNYWIALVILINSIALLRGEKYNFKKSLLSTIGIAIVLFAIVYEPIRKLKVTGNLYYGGNTGFYSDTLESLTKYSLYTTESNSLIYYSLNIFLLVLILTILISFFFNRTLYSLKNIVLSVTTLCILSVVLQHHLLDTPYLIDRTALFFYPLFILSLCFSLNDFYHKSTSIIISLIVMVFGINFFSKANLYKITTWYFDSHSEEILNLLNKKGAEQERKIKIDFSWPFQSSFGYYVRQNNYPYIEIVKNKQDREDLNANADYYIYLTKSLEKVGYDANAQKILPLIKDTVLQYKDEKTMLFTGMHMNRTNIEE